MYYPCLWKMYCKGICQPFFFVSSLLHLILFYEVDFFLVLLLNKQPLSVCLLKAGKLSRDKYLFLS